MTTISDKEFEKIFEKTLNAFLNEDDIFDENDDDESSPPDYGNMSPIDDSEYIPCYYGNTLHVVDDDAQVPHVDIIVDEKEKLLKFITVMPGLQESDIKINVGNIIVDISAENNKKKYHVIVPMQYKVVKNYAESTYKNGVLQTIFKLVEEEK